MEQTTQQPSASSSKSKTILMVIALVIIILLAFLWWWQTNSIKTNTQPTANVQNGELTTTTVPLEDTTPVIKQDLQGINDVNLDKEFQSINADLNKL